MSTLAVSEVVEEQRSTPTLAVVPGKPVENDRGTLDQHPLVPVFIVGIIAFMLSSAMIGSILLWISLRDSW